MKKLISIFMLSALLCVSLLSLSSCNGRNAGVRITVKDYGVIDLELERSAAPKTVKNFVKLVKADFYDGLTFHRVVDGFVIQGGDPKGDGTGGTTPITGEFLKNGYYNPIPHARGVISMARGDDNNSASCQFFIVHKTSQNNSWSLDGSYAAFGRVTSGMEVVDAIVENAIVVDAGSGQVANPAVIESIEILYGGTDPLMIVLWSVLGGAIVIPVATCFTVSAVKKKKAAAAAAAIKASSANKGKKK